MNSLTASKFQKSNHISPDGMPVIRFEDVAVLYRVPRERVSGLKEFAVRWLQRRLRYEEFWALRDISFDVKRGEVFGVIGRNGAGKSTMLKVMARVLHPTRGRVVMNGKIAPLLELGAGFHPELTGRENVYLNSALLGYTRRQVGELFPSILDFAEIGDFIDAPLRTYSTGMVARLGFSVATCKRPDILLVDEVLSVGDSRFQEKCLDRMNSFQAEGTTIVIVSHSMQTIQNFCSRALWLEQGQPGAIGAVSEVISRYTS
jgi:ABC-2 type transport system ATP-binding protein